MKCHNKMAEIDLMCLYNDCYQELDAVKQQLQQSCREKHQLASQMRDSLEHEKKQELLMLRDKLQQV